MPALADLEASVAATPSAIVAFSGGVDSSLVAAVAARVLGEHALAITALSPAVATGELDGARSVAASVGIAHEVVRTAELEREAYRRNAPDRCYHCKTELYETLGAIANERGYAAVLSGANLDDLGDWRPGLRAAREHSVRHPLVEAGFAKADVRRVARDLGLPSAEKPAMPCLASRVPFGTPVDLDVLRRIDDAERRVKALGFTDLRVRHLGDTARVEIAEADLAAALERRDAVIAAVVAAGYHDADLSNDPLRSGSLTRQLLPIAVVGDRTA
jgi:pyridinium-3,5-biscarboxylic acid mononucleotide sulfurtransferase